MRLGTLAALLLATARIASSYAVATNDDVSDVQEYLDDANTLFLLMSAMMVFTMQSGFTMLEVGAVREIAMKSILLKNIFDASLAALLWWACGYAFAYGSDPFGKTGSNGFIGTSGFFYSGKGSGEDGSPLTQTVYGKTHGKAVWVFNWAFAGVAGTIVSGAVAERCKFFAYLMYSFTITGFIYPIVVHLVWSKDGFFSANRTNRLCAGCGVIDFAGSGVVHMTGGIASLVGATIVGPREGRFDTIQGPNGGRYASAFQTLGVLLLWFGWYGFNVGSTGGIVGKGGLGAHVMMTTTIAASTGCFATTAITYVFEKDNATLVRNANNGILAGLVSITAGCATSSLWASFVIAVVASFVYFSASRLLIYLRIDDPVDAFAVHGVCGLWGVIAAALFAAPFYYSRAYDDERAHRCASVFYGGNPGGSLQAAVLFCLFLIAWVTATGLLAFLLIHLLLPGGARMALEAHASWETAVDFDERETSELVRLDQSDTMNTKLTVESDDDVMRNNVDRFEQRFEPEPDPD
ncbi:hypothetical protein CTAYLR_010205 [Chrysophaeum taylorii]|uniref:Ammonium transporter AmtB-like domain-containing protein n=1 Tax=Chrysophaeum taylorii TaxID=2483200 RepID=A0AAD7XLI5_9STRA|nr:hypothetical protein CTAYLR_010205 [Chrysophaeum taylorii]